jgi:hypothetical protein
MLTIGLVIWLAYANLDIIITHRIIIVKHEFQVFSYSVVETSYCPYRITGSWNVYVMDSYLHISQKSGERFRRFLQKEPLTNLTGGGNI